MTASPSPQSEIQQLFMASTLHEIKNQLGQVMNAVEGLKEKAALSAEDAESQYLDAQFQCLNFRLGQLLQGYKSQTAYQLRLDYHDLVDFFEEASIRHQSLKNQIQLTFDDTTDLCPCFDEALMINVLDTFIYNALQAGASQIHLSSEAEKDDPQSAWIIIEDNGPGFPAELLEQPIDQLKPGNFRQHKSGLGLYMANAIVKSHKNQKGTAGHLLLDNHSSLNGARIRVLLP